MILRIDPRLAVVWRSPTEIQFGSDLPVAVVTELSSAGERVIWALRLGVSRLGLGTVGESAGASTDEVARIVRALTPTFLTELAPSAPSSITVAVDGDPDADNGGSSRFIRAMLRQVFDEFGFGVADRWSTPRPSVAVLIGTHVLSPGAAQFWLSNDIAHLPVTFGDQAATVGPFVVPGVTACLHCISIHRSSRDPAWPAIASQLLGSAGRQASADTPGAALQAAAEVARALENWTRTGLSGLENVSLLINARTGEVSRRAWLPSEKCQCRSPAESVTAPVVRIGAARPATRTAEGRLALG